MLEKVCEGLGLQRRGTGRGDTEGNLTDVNAHVLKLDSGSRQTFTKATLVLGDAGVGTSALMVAWTRRFEQRQRGNIGFFFKHYCGLNNETADWVHVVKRAMDSIRSTFGLRKKVVKRLDLLAGSFSQWIHIIDILEVGFQLS